MSQQKKGSAPRSSTRQQGQTVALARSMPKTNKGPALQGKGHNVVIRHRELVADAVSATTFTPQQVILQPGLSSMFPWLSTIATSYEKYVVRKLSYEYVPQCASTAVGSFGMYFDYDPKDGSVTSKTDFSSQDRAVLTQLWQSNILKVDCDKTQYLVRNGSISGDVVLYDKGSFNYYLQSPSTVNGFIFVDYEIELIKPQVQTGAPVIAPSILIAEFACSAATGSTSAGSTVAYNSGFTLSGKNLQVPTSGDYLVEVCQYQSSGSASEISAFFGFTPFSTIDVNVGFFKVLPLVAGTNYSISLSGSTTGALTVKAVKLV